jgi:hypothetical protein
MIKVFLRVIISLHLTPIIKIFINGIKGLINSAIDVGNALNTKSQDGGSVKLTLALLCEVKITSS